MEPLVAKMARSNFWLQIVPLRRASNFLLHSRQRTSRISGQQNFGLLCRLLTSIKLSGFPVKHIWQMQQGFPGGVQPASVQPQLLSAPARRKLLRTRNSPWKDGRRDNRIQWQRPVEEYSMIENKPHLIEKEVCDLRKYTLYLHCFY